jgi:DNA polymerase-3 subunit alpha
MVQRLPSRSLNRRALESLINAGALDCFEGVHRAQYYAMIPGENMTAIEKILKMSGSAARSAPLMNSLFGEMPTDTGSITFRFPEVEPWPEFEKLRREKEVTGLYISGHPLDAYRHEIKSFCNCNLSSLDSILNKDVSFACIVIQASHQFTKKQMPYGSIEIEDRTGSKRLHLFGGKYLRFKHLLVPGNMLYIEGGNFKNEYKDDYEFAIKNIILLPELRSYKCKSIKLRGDIDELRFETTLYLMYLIEKHLGNYPMYIEIKDTDGVSVYLDASHMRVNLNDEFLNELESMHEFEFFLN